MELILIAVKDNAVQAFQPINSVRAKGQALRGFMDAINNPQNADLNNHPEDYDLYIVGTYDDQTGIITPCTPELILRGVEARKTVN